MDLKEYLVKTRLKRKELINNANAALNKSVDWVSHNENSEKSEIYRGPTPKKLKKFEENVNNQLKLLFNSPIPEDKKQKVHIVSFTNIRERIKKVYIQKTDLIKRRQVVIKPRPYFYPGLTSVSNKYIEKNSNSPYPSSTETQSRKTLTPIQKNHKKKLKIPDTTSLLKYQNINLYKCS